MDEEQSAEVKKISSNPTTSSSIGGVAASNHGNHSLNGSLGKGFYNEAHDEEKLLDNMRLSLMEKYEDVLTDKLGE